MKRRLMGSTFLGSKNFLRYPGEGDNLSGTQEDQKPGGSGSQQQGNQQQAGGEGDDDTGVDDESIDSLFKKQGDDDDISTGDDPEDFMSESEVDDSAIDQEFATKAEGLKTSINDLLTKFVVNESDIPDELGFGDKSKAAEFMTNLQKRAVQQSMQIMNPVISHVMNLAVAKINNRLKSEVKTNGTASAAKAAFDSLGFTNQADRSTALVFYKRGLDSKMSPQKAAAATQRAMAMLGKSPKPKKGQGGGNPQSGKLEGADALDSIFG